MEVDQSVCIVTGPPRHRSSHSRQLSELGARVVLAARRTDRIEALARGLPDSLAVTTDVTIGKESSASCADHRHLRSGGRVGEQCGQGSTCRSTN